MEAEAVVEVVEASEMKEGIAGAAGSKSTELLEGPTTGSSSRTFPPRSLGRLVILLYFYPFQKTPEERFYF